MNVQMQSLPGSLLEPASGVRHVCVHLQSLPGFTRQKAYRKRASGRARLAFPGGFQLAVSMYSLVQPATKGSPVFLNAVNNEPLKVESAFIDQDTGAAALPSGLPRCRGQLSSDSRDARQYLS